MLDQLNQGFSRLHAIKGELGCCAWPKKVNASQRTGLIAKNNVFPGKKARLGSELYRRRRGCACTHERPLAVVPQADGRVTRHDLVPAVIRIKQQTIIRQKPKAIGGKTGSQRGLASARFAHKGNRVVANLDCAGMHNDFSLFGQRERQDLIEKEMMGSIFRHFRGREASYFHSIPRNQKISQIRKAQQIATFRTMELRPLAAVWENPLVETDRLQRSLDTCLRHMEFNGQKIPLGQIKLTNNNWPALG